MQNICAFCERQHKHIKSTGMHVLRTRHKIWTVHTAIPSYSYTGIESGDSRSFISTKIAQSLFKFLTWITRHYNKMVSMAKAEWMNDTYLYPLFFVTYSKILNHYLQPALTTSLSYKSNVWSTRTHLTKHYATMLSLKTFINF